MSFQCTYCHINYDDNSICHKVKSLYGNDNLFVTLCDHCYNTNYVKLKKEQDDENRSMKDICFNEKCNNVRHNDKYEYKYCSECMSGIRKIIKKVEKDKNLNKSLLSDCNKNYGTNYYIIYPHWDLFF